MNIAVRDLTLVRPAQATPNERLRVSNIDCVVKRIHTPLVCFYKSNGSSNFFDIRVLKEALRNVLVYFYPVAGRLAQAENGRIEIHCNAKGVLFIEAETGSTIDDLGDFTHPAQFQQLIPVVDYSATISSYPLLLLQVTFFKCGGICLGIGWHHSVADGTSAFHFIKTWFEMARGLSVAIPPSIDRAPLRARDPPAPAFHHVEYDPSPTLNHSPQTPDSHPPAKPTSTAILKITVHQLAALKRKAKNDDNTVHYSTFQALAAHIWRCACKARGLPPDQASKFYSVANGRPRFRPPVPTHYFGNAIFLATSIALSGDIVSKPLSHTVNIVHESIRRMDNEYLRSALDYLEEQPDLTALVGGAHRFRSPNMCVVSWIGLGIHDADFGWGRPVFSGPAKVVFEGTAYVLPSPTNDGSLSVVIALETDHVQLFRKLFHEF